MPPSWRVRLCKPCMHIDHDRPHCPCPAPDRRAARPARLAAGGQHVSGEHGARIWRLPPAAAARTTPPPRHRPARSTLNALTLWRVADRGHQHYRHRHGRHAGTRRGHRLGPGCRRRCLRRAGRRRQGLVHLVLRHPGQRRLRAPSWPLGANATPGKPVRESWLEGARFALPTLRGAAGPLSLCCCPSPERGSPARGPVVSHLKGSRHDPRFSTLCASVQRTGHT